MKIMKKLMLLFMCALIVLQFSLPVVNATEFKNTELGTLDYEYDISDIQQGLVANEVDAISTIIAELGQLRARQLHNSETETYTVQSGTSDEIAALENQLESLGVEVLSAEDVALLESENQPYIFTPTQSNRVRWYRYGSYHVYEGQVYYVNHLYAQGLTNESNLADTNMNLELKTTFDHVLSATSKIISFLFSFASLGSSQASQELSWIPIDFLLNAGDIIQDLEYEVRYTYVMTACFSYVSKSTSIDDDRLCFSATQVHITGDNTVMGIVDGKTHREIVDFDRTIVANGFASNERACASFVYVSAPDKSFVDDWDIRDISGNRWNRINFSQPSAPASVY